MYVCECMNEAFFLFFCLCLLSLCFAYTAWAHRHHLHRCEDNVNPVERVERSALIMASTIHQQPVKELVNPSSSSTECGAESEHNARASS